MILLFSLGSLRSLLYCMKCRILNHGWLGNKCEDVVKFIGEKSFKVKAALKYQRLNDISLQRI